jgi:hypothetical protein
MAAPCIAPPGEEPVVKKNEHVSEPKPVREKPTLRDSLVEILEGHEEFLGWTPD